MATNGLGYMAADEFLQTFTYGFALDEAKTFLKDYLPKNLSTNPFVQEAIDSTVSLLEFAGIFKLIQYESELLERLFNFVSGVVSALLLVSKKGIENLKGSLSKGRKFKFLQKLIRDYGEDALVRAQIILEWLKAYILGRQTGHQAGQIVEANQSNRSAVVQRDQSAMNMGKGMADNYVNSLMFKLFTSSFTPKDHTMLRNILGRDTVSELDVADMNKIGSFMFTTGTDGKLTGLTEQFFSLLNGMGYVTKHVVPVA